MIQYLTKNSSLQVYGCEGRGELYLFCIRLLIFIHTLVFLLLFYTNAYVDCTFWILRSMLSGRLKRNLKRCRTLSALRVESALSFRPKTSWNRVSAVSLAPTRNTERREEEKEAGANEKLGYYKNKCLIPHFPFNVGLWFSSCSACSLTQ